MTPARVVPVAGSGLIAPAPRAAAEPPGTPPLAVYAAALRRAAAGARSELTAVGTGQRVRAYQPGVWCGDPREGDAGVLDRCTGPVLDVGCGPGRICGSLAERGHPVLGIDVSGEAVRLARRRGVRVLRRDVFAALPGEGSWWRVLLVDGNVGIGGDPERLLRRCRELVAPGGGLLVEVDPPGAGSWSGEVRIRLAGGAPSSPFPWAYLDADDLPAPAAAAGLRICEQWTEAGRWFACLAPG